MIRALIVDDHPQNLVVLRKVLELAGYEVDEARHGVEALAKARQAPPQLIISDLLMPVMDGYTLLRNWKADERLKAIPFIVYTATYTEPRDEQLALALGADAFILKPAELKPFMAKIEHVLTQQDRGKFTPPQAPVDDEPAQLKEYSEILVRKLEDKALQLEQANRALQEDITRREKIEAEAARLYDEALRARTALLSILEDQQKTEAALRESDERHRLLLDQSPYAFYVHQKGRIVFANPAAVSMYGARTATDLVGKPILDLIHTDHQKAARERIDQSLNDESGVNLNLVEGRHLRLDGRAFEVEVSTAPFTYQGRPAVQVIALDISGRKHAERELRESRAALEALARRLLEVQESERRAIARELHDEVGGLLTAVKLNLQSLSRDWAGKAGGGALADGLALVDNAIQAIRSLSLDLRPVVLDDLGLIPALKWYCERQASSAGIPIELALEAIDLKPVPQLESTCFRIVQEALTNALRHAHARRIQVALRRTENAFLLEIADDGGGFDLAMARQRTLAGESSGLHGMEERVKLLQGRLIIDSAPGAGTCITAEFAVPEEGFG